MFLSIALQEQHKNQPSIFPWRSADEQGAVFAQESITFDQNLLLSPDLKVQIDPTLIRRAFGIDFHEQIPGGNDPGFIFAEYVLPMLAKDFKVLEGENFGKALIELRQLIMGRFFAASQLGSIVGGENECAPDMTICRVFDGRNVWWRRRLRTGKGRAENQRER